MPAGALVCRPPTCGVARVRKLGSARGRFGLVWAHDQGSVVMELRWGARGPSVNNIGSFKPDGVAVD